MPFLTCPNCGKSVSETWQSCVFCNLSMSKIRQARQKAVDDQNARAKNLAESIKRRLEYLTRKNDDTIAELYAQSKNFGEERRLSCSRCVHLRNETCSGLNGPCPEYRESTAW